MDIGSGQQLVWENKKAKGFNTTDVPLEFCLLQGEVAEAFDAWRKGRADAEVLVVQDSLEDLIVGVDTGNDGLQELLVEHQAEVIQAVVLGLVGKLAIGHPAFLELIEKKLVNFGEVHAEAVVQHLDDAGKML